MTNKTLRCWLAIELSKPLNQSLNKSKVIQAFGLAEYCTGNVIPLKQRGFLNLPMVNNGYFFCAVHVRTYHESYPVFGFFPSEALL